MVAFFCMFANGALAETKLTLLTEEDRPASWVDPDGSLHGTGVDAVRLVMDQSGTPYKMHILPWPRVYQAVQEQRNTCAFPMALTEQRRGLFNWVRPLGFSELWLYGLDSFAGTVASLEDVRSWGFTIGVQMGDVTEAILQQQGGLKIASVANDALNFRKLATGRIDLWAGGKNTAKYGEDTFGVHLKPILKFASVEIAMACNKNVPGADIATIAQALAELRASGRVAAVWGSEN